MARSRFLCWLVVLLYVVVGGVQTVHALDQDFDSVSREWSGPSTPSFNCSGTCSNPLHHHPPAPKSHDHEHCPLCQLASAPAARLERPPQLISLHRAWTPVLLGVEAVSFRHLSSAILARGPPQQV